jgi:hypothetical protein
VISKTVVLHIGAPKTGTTSILRFLEESKLNGSLGSVCYPLWNGDRSQRRLGMIYPPLEMFTPWMRQTSPGKQGQRYRQFLLDELGSSGGAVLSSELLSNLSPSVVGQLRDDLESAGYREFHIVLYVRDPADFYLSVTQQDLKDYAVYLSAPQLVQDPGLFRYDFLRSLEPWEQIFPGKVIVRKFPTDPQGDVVEDFAGVLEDCLGVTLPRIPMRTNTSISAEAMQILQDYRQAFWPDDRGLITSDAARLAGFLSRSATEIPQTKPVLKQEVAERLRANHKADAEVLYSRYGVDLGLGEFSPKLPPSARRAYRVDEIVQSVDAEIVYQLLLRLARTELSRPPAGRSLPRRIASRAYHAIPSSRRPERLAAKLRSIT